MKKVSLGVVNEVAADASSANASEEACVFSRKCIVEAYGDLIEQRVGRGWDAFLLTFLFKSLPGNQNAVLLQMSKALERFYAIFVTRVARNPRSPSARNELPVLICAPDRPVRKQRKSATRAIPYLAINDGLHYHGILAIPPRSRLHEGAEWHFRENGKLYLSQSSLISFDVEPITTRPGHVTQYALKAIAHFQFDPDDILVFPKSFSEVSS